MLQNVRAFLGLSPEDGQTDALHFGSDDDHSGAVYFDLDEADDNTEERSTLEVDGHEAGRELEHDTELVADDESHEVYLAEVQGGRYRAASSKQRGESRRNYGHRGSTVRSAEADVELHRRRERTTSGRLKTANRGRLKRSEVEPDTAMRLQEARPKIVKPRSFDDAQTVADGFAAEIPIVMNLTSADQELARRLIDFASGFCYVSGGEMERIRSRVFLLLPRAATLSAEDRRLLVSRRYDR